MLDVRRAGADLTEALVTLTETGWNPMRHLNSDRGQGIAEFVLIIALLALLAIGALALFGPIFSTLVSMLASNI